MRMLQAAFSFQKASRLVVQRHTSAAWTTKHRANDADKFLTSRKRKRRPKCLAVAYASGSSKTIHHLGQLLRSRRAGNHSGPVRVWAFQTGVICCVAILAGVPK